MKLRSGIEIPADQVADVCRRYGVHELLVFGSAAKGGLRPDSDIDLLVEFEPHASVGYFDLFAMEEELTRLLGRRVEATTRQGLKPWIRPSVEQDAETIFHAA